MGFAHGWMWGIVFGFAPLSLAAGTALGSGSALWLIGELCGCVVFCLANGHLRNYAANRRVLRAGSALAAVAALAVVLAEWAPPEGAAVLACGGFFLGGLLFSGFMVLWVQAFSMMGHREVQFSIALSLTVGVVFALLCSLLPRIAAGFVLSALPVASAFFLPERRLPPLTTYNVERLIADDRLSDRYPIAFILCSVPFSLASGFLYGADFSHIAVEASPLALFAGIGACGILFAFIRPQRLVLALASLLTTCGLVVMAFASPAVGSVLVAVGSCCFEVLLCMVAAELVKVHRKLAARIPAVLWMVVVASTLTGSVLGSLVLGADDRAGALGIACGSIIVLMMAAVTLMFTRSALKYIVGTDDDAQSLAEVEVGEEVDAVRVQCLVVAREYGLTKREGELLDLLAHGHGAPYIENELVISRNTVKSHMKNIYRKLGVSSREELMAKVASVPLKR